MVLLVFAMTLANISTTKAQLSGQDEEGVTLFVEFTFDEKDMDTALDLLSEMQMQVLENEEGCIAYDLLMSDDAPNKVFIYESYENKDALNKHNNTPYFKDIVKQKLPKYIKDSKIITMYPLNQDSGDDGEGESDNEV